MRSTLGRPRDPARDAAIQRAAVDLFIEQGFEGVSFEKVAQRAGVSRTTIYRRWTSKRDLLVSALRNARKPQYQLADEIGSKSADELVQHLADALLESLTTPKFEKIVPRLLGSAGTHPELLAAYRHDFIDPAWHAIYVALERARAAKKLPSLGDPELLLQLLAGATLTRLLTRKGPVRAKKEKEWVERLFERLGLDR